ncbi:hypothetical protein DAEQUDRAFT_709612 [Daedalea quercina L-15889]|uniref:F-box domain-containing protein n=1 Tax=Daedalea quercina L-15889 TaxID=1314783 RepID=A0A165QRJ8_9APHY|nr:hypothetical protein DAEQUDRAFT_709612 [Daedalea quercina L-15889]
MVRELPQELLDQVVDHTWDDRKALIACNAASRVFVPAARTHIFHAVTLNGSESCKRFERVLTGSPDVAHYVRKLKLVAHHFSYHSGAYRNVDSAWVARVPGLIGRFRRLAELELESLNWNTLQLCAARVYPFLEAIYRLKRLVLTNVHFGCSSQIQDVLCVAVNLTEFRCDGVYWSYWSPMRQHSFAHPLGLCDEPRRPPLRRLVMRPGSPSLLFTKWLLRPGCDLKLQGVDLHWRERELTNVLGDLLRSTGVHLELLFLELSRSVAEETLSNNCVDLSANPNLRRVRLDGTVLPDCSHWVSTFIAQIISTQLEAIEVGFLAPCARHLHAFDWSSLDKALSHPRFEGVQVTFDISLALWQENNQAVVYDIIYNALPGFRSKGDLVIGCT